MQVTDDFKVKSVYLEIREASGTIVESGLATMQPNRLDWVFTAKVANASLAGDKITIKATDMPGNETTETQDI